MNPPNTFVFVASTANQALIFIELHRHLTQQGCITRFLTLEQIYSQGAHETLTKTGLNAVSIPLEDPPKDWCSLDHTERLPYIDEITPWVWEYFADPTIHTVIVGNDVGDIEQLCLRSAERYGIRTIRVQDGSQGIRADLRPAKAGNPPSLYPPAPMEGGCEEYCIWSEHLQKRFEARGLSGHPTITGSVRHDAFLQIPKYTKRRSLEHYTLGIAGQSFGAYGAMWHAQELSLYQHIVHSCLSRKDVKILLRPHPEAAMKECYKLAFEGHSEGIRLDFERSLLDFLGEIDLLVTVDSSVAADATALGIPAYRLTHLRSPIPSKELLEHEQAFRRYLHSDSFPFLTEEEYKKDPEQIAAIHTDCYARNYIGIIDGKATRRVLDVLSSPTPQPETMPENEVTVLITSGGEDPVPTILTALRTLRSGDKMVFIDRTPDSAISHFLSHHVHHRALSFQNAPNTSEQDALKNAIEKIDTPYILRLKEGTRLLPNAIEKFVALALETPNAPFTSSSFYGCNSSELSEGIVVIPEDLDTELFSRYNSYGMLSYCYLSSKENTVKGGGFQSSDATDLSLLHQLLNITKTPPAIHRAPLFISPPHYGMPSWKSFDFHRPQYEKRWKNRESIPHHPHDLEAELVALLAKKNYQEVLTRVATIQEEEITPQCLYLKALAQAKVGMEKESITTLQTVVRLESSHSEAKNLLQYLSSSR
jgi:hypothetical protein